MPSPLEIMIGLHYWTTPAEYADHDCAHQESPAVQEVLADFVARGLLRNLDVPNQYGGTYASTEALEVWVNGICDVPFPVQKWVLPSTDGANR
jgi:hypothetical protein